MKTRTDSSQSVRRWALAALAVLAALFFSLSLWVDKRTNAGVTDGRTEEIEKAMHRLQREAYQLVNEAFASTPGSACPDFDVSWPDKMRDKGVSLYIIERGSAAAYW